MCGIAGIISADINKVSRHRLRQMTDSIVHRGPESEGFWLNKDGVVALGHRRLSIIDLTEAGSQPMHYHDRYTITYNGEIYNYLELKELLEKKGFSFRSHCDTEVILAAYACFGQECLQHFDGMFAFAIWDEQEQILFCARDRFGEKPFYYAQYQNTFVFGSEMKALWAAGVHKKTRPDMLLTYLALGLNSDLLNEHQTFFDNIYKLPAGHYLVLKHKESANGHYNLLVKSYWDLQTERMIAINEDKASAHLLELLQTSIQRRLRSDVAIGTSLSGGLDSSTIVALISQSGITGQKTFSAVFPGFAKDESSYIEQVAAQYQLQCFTISPNANDLVTSLEKLVYHQEEPFQSTSIFAQYKVYELAKQHGVTVLLDGQGADEILAGYPKYYHWYWQELLASGQIKQCWKEIELARRNGVPVRWNWKNYLAACLPATTARQLEKRAVQKVNELAFIDKDFLAGYVDMKIPKPEIRHLNEILYYNTRVTGLSELLRYADRNSMAHSREVRLPFLNHTLVEYLFSLPSSFKIRNGFTKWILRNSMAPLLPESITWRKDKVGFEPPQQQWMQQPAMKDYLHQSRLNLVNKGILSPEILNTPIQARAAHHADNLDWRYLCADLCMKA